MIWTTSETIYGAPTATEPLDQGDIIDDCPLIELIQFDPDDAANLKVRHAVARVVVVTQTCDLVGQKTSRVVVAPAYDAQALVDEQKLKPSDIRGSIRAGRVFGWYFLPANSALGLSESIVDLRQLHTIPIDVLAKLCERGQRRARIQPLYREHLANTYSRIGLPEPYQTEP